MMITPASEEAHPLYLYTVLLRRFGGEFFQWLPETRHMLMKDTYGEVEELAYHKIEAISTVLQTSTVYFNWPVFEKVCAAFNNVIGLPYTMQKPSIGGLIHTISILRAIDANAFSDEMARYMAGVLLNDGVIYAPPPIDFAQPAISEYLETRKQEDLHRVVKERYERFKGDPAKADAELAVNAVDIQVGMLLAADQYTEQQLELAKAQLLEANRGVQRD